MPPLGDLDPRAKFDPNFDILMDEYDERTPIRLANRVAQASPPPVSTPDEPWSIFSWTPKSYCHAWCLGVLLGFLIEILCVLVQW